MNVSNFQDQKPVKKEAGITYDFTLLNWLFKDAEVTKRARDMKKNNAFNLRFFQIFGDEPQVRYQEKEELDSIYTMTPDIQIAAILS